jgi:hypothetical protein
MLQRIEKEQVRVPDSLLADNLQHEETRLAALGALRELKSETVLQELQKWVLDESVAGETRLAALHALERTNHPLMPPDAWYRSANDDLRIAMLQCEATMLPEIYVSRTPPQFLQRYLRTKSFAVRGATFDFLLTREELWAKQLVASLLAEADDLPLRRRVLHSLPPNYFHDGTVLLKIASGRTDPLRLDALQRLRGTTDSHTIEGLMAIASDKREDQKARVLAATTLPASYAKDLLPGLLGSS